MSIAEELERLEIIKRISSGHYIIQATLDEIDAIFLITIHFTKDSRESYSDFFL